VLPACSFLLNFDELQAGDEDAGVGGSSATGGSGATGGSSGSGGSAGNDGGGTGGSAGNPTCLESCDDSDPCTDDSCDETAAPPRCKNDPVKRIVDDGYEAEIQADEVHRVTLASGGDAFYFTVFETTNGSPELTLYRLRNGESEHEELVKFAGIIGLLRPQSAAGMVVDTRAGLALHGFYALGDSVYHIVLDGTFELANATNTVIGNGTYDALNPRRHPLAGAYGTSVAGAWINKDGTISVGAAGRPVTPLGNATNPATQLALIGTRDTPGVLWTSNNGVFVQLAGSPPAPAAQLTQCEARAGIFTSATAAPILGDFWLTSWTKAGGIGTNAFIVSENRSAGCMAPFCAGTDTSCDADSTDPGVRNLAFVIATRAGDPPGTVFAATAAPYLAPDQAGTGLEAGLQLLVARIDFGEVPFQTDPVPDPIGEVELSRMAPQGTLREGPDFPAISILPPDRLAVAWIEPRASSDVLRSKRFKICAP